MKNCKGIKPKKTKKERKQMENNNNNNGKWYYLVFLLIVVICVAVIAASILSNKTEVKEDVNIAYTELIKNRKSRSRKNRNDCAEVLL